MNEENKIVIISDDGNAIHFDDVTIKHDIVDRAEVERAETLISEIEKEIADKTIELEQLKQRVAKAKEIIALADEKKAQEEITNEVVDGAEENVVVE